MKKHVVFFLLSSYPPLMRTTKLACLNIFIKSLTTWSIQRRKLVKAFAQCLMGVIGKREYFRFQVTIIDISTSFFICKRVCKGLPMYKMDLVSRSGEAEEIYTGLSHIPLREVTIPSFSLSRHIQFIIICMFLYFSVYYLNHFLFMYTLWLA